MAAAVNGSAQNGSSLLDVLTTTMMNASAAVDVVKREDHPEVNTVNQPVTVVTDLVGYVGIGVALFGMGCVISIKDFSRKEMHLPQSVVIGLAVQYLMQPLIGYLIAVIFKMNVYNALAMVMLSCCPVSPYCAVLVYYGNGFVIVGLCLAMFSSALAIGLIPFWFSFYSSTWTESYYVIGIPLDIGYAEALILIPTLLGVIFKRYAGHRRARVVARICSCAFLLSASIVPILSAIDHPELFQGDWQLWMGGITLPFVGFVIGFILAYALKLPYEVCSAVSLAVGTPNWYFASSMAWRFFADDAHALHEVLVLVSVFSITMPIEGLVWSIMFRAIESFLLKIYPKCCAFDDDDDDDDEYDDDYDRKVKKKLKMADVVMEGKSNHAMIILGQVLDDDDEEEEEEEDKKEENANYK